MSFQPEHWEEAKGEGSYPGHTPAAIEFQDEQGIARKEQLWKRIEVRDMICVPLEQSLADMSANGTSD